MKEAINQSDCKCPSCGKEIPKGASIFEYWDGSFVCQDCYDEEVLEDADVYSS